MNVIEAVGIAVSALLTFAHLHRSGFKRSQALASTALILPALFVAWRDATEFLTTDELYVILEPIYLKHSDLQQWRYGFMHTTTALLAAPLQFFREVLSLPQPELKGIAKGLHLLSGYAVFLTIFKSLSSLFIPEKGRSIFFVIFSYTMLLLPMNLVALRVFNYDLLALGFGILSYCFVIEALLKKDSRKSLISIVIAALAAQEKLSASPFLLLAITVHAMLGRRPRTPGAVLASVMSGNGIACAVFLLTGLVAVASEAPASQIFSTRLLFYPLVGWALPLLVSFAHGSVTDSYPLWTLALSVLAPLIGALAAVPLWKQVTRIGWRMPVKAGTLSLLALTLALGIYGTFVMETNWAPPAPVAPGKFVPTDSFNGMIMHFGAATRAGHKFSALAWALAVFLNAVPTLVWAGAALLLLPAKAIRSDTGKDLALRLTLLGAVAAPFAFGLSRVPVGNKYLQIPIALLACVASIAFFQKIFSMKSRMRTGICAAAMAGIFLEMSAFSPLYAAFRPFWVRYGEHYDRNPVVGRLNPSWIGWGEEGMIAGRMIRASCDRGDARCDDVRIYCNYAGDWIFPARDIGMHCAAPWAERELRFTDQDYYVLNRSKLVQGGFFPVNSKPFMTIEFRGFVQGWIFRGDQVKDSGLHLR